MNGTRIFISGGAGVIGREMVPLLIKRGYNVFVGDLKPRPPEFSHKVHYRQGDLNSLTQHEWDAFSPEIFIHLAATFERSIETSGFWEKNFWHNVRLSHHLMSLAKNSKSLRRVVFASSYLIYDPGLYQFPAAQTKPKSLKETDPVLPRNLTGMAKLSHETELRFLNQFDIYNFTTVNARIFRGYGRNSRDVISRWIRSLLSGEKIEIYRPEGMFDYIYAKDSAEGLIRLAETENTENIINLGTGHARRVQDIVDILSIYFPDANMVYTNNNCIPFEASQADMTLFKENVGWLPEYSLEQGIAEIIEYEKSRKRNVFRTYSKHPEKTLKNILITSASRKVPLVEAMKKAAKKINPNSKIVAGDIDKNALSKYVADEFWCMPRTIDSELDALIEGCKKFDISVIYPSRDGELLFWAKNKPLFTEHGINVLVSSFESINTCLDKLAFSKFGQERNLPFIPSAQHPDNLDADSFVVKERYGAGSHKIKLNCSRDEALLHGKLLEDPIYQPFVKGREISIDAWMYNNHVVKGLVMRTRDLIVHGESQVTTTFFDPKIQAEAIRVLEHLKLCGHVVLQALLDSANNVRIIECNPRFGGASTISITAGLDSLFWSLLEAIGAEVRDYPFERVEGQVRQVRVPYDIYFQLPAR